MYSPAPASGTRYWQTTEHYSLWAMGCSWHLSRDFACVFAGYFTLMVVLFAILVLVRHTQFNLHPVSHVAYVRSEFVVSLAL